MDKYFTGYCPVLDGEHSIRITYLNASTLHNQSFIKERFHCKHSLQNGCQLPDCPVYGAAPETL